MAKAESDSPSEEVTLVLRLNGPFCLPPALWLLHLPLLVCKSSGSNSTISLPWTAALTEPMSLLPCHHSCVPTSAVCWRNSPSRRNTFSPLLHTSTIWQNSQKSQKYELNSGPHLPQEDIREVFGSLSEPKCLTIFETLVQNSPHSLWITVVFQSLYKVMCKETKLFYQADRYSKLLVLNKHGNTSVKSNKFKLNEISICLQCISLWHFLYCHGALIKFFKMQRKCL